MNLSSESESEFTNDTAYATNDFYIIPAHIAQWIEFVHYLGVITFLTLSGYILNTLCCIMFYRLKKKSCTVIMLIALAFTDILTLTTGMFQVFIKCSDMYGKPFSKDTRTRMMPYVAPYITVVPMRIGNILTLLLSLERLCCVTRPLKIRQYSTKRNGIIAVFLSYMLPIVLCLPNLFYLKTETIYINSTRSFRTMLRPTEFRKQLILTDAIYIITEILFRFIPVFVVMVTSIFIWVVVVLSDKRRLAISTVRDQSSKESQVTRTLLTITFVFVFCKLPVTILRMIAFIESETTTKSKNNVYDVLGFISYDLMLVNSVVNFFIYYFTSSTYNAEFKKLFNCNKTYQLPLPETRTVSSRCLDYSEPDFTTVPTVSRSKYCVY